MIAIPRWVGSSFGWPRRRPGWSGRSPGRSVHLPAIGHTGTRFHQYVYLVCAYTHRAFADVPPALVITTLFACPLRPDQLEQGAGSGKSRLIYFQPQATWSAESGRCATVGLTVRGGGGEQGGRSILHADRISVRETT